MQLRRVPKQTLSDQVFEQLSREIVEGRMAPGMSLPAERELCETLGVNRGALREALRRLAQANLVSIGQGGATRVLDYRRSGGLGLLSQLLLDRNGGIDVDVARSIMEIRAALAPDIARLCARRADAKLIANLRAQVRHIARAHRNDDLDALAELSLELWDLMVRGSQNIAYELAFNTLRETYDKIRAAMIHVMEQENRDLPRVQAMVEAIARRDEQRAQGLAAELIDHGTRGVLELLETLSRSNGHGRGGVS